MISKSEINKIRSLDSKKGRDLHSLILIEGKRLIEQVITSNYNISKIWITDDFSNKNANLISKIKDISIDLISDRDLKKITATQNPSGIVGVLEIPKGNPEKLNQPLIILDNIADPGNLGTILRTAEWFGIHNVALSKDCVDPYNSKVVRSAMGAHFNMNIIRIKIEEYIKKLQSDNFQIIAADLNTDKSIESLNLKNDKWALLMGSEAHGLSQSVKNLIDCKIKIPQVGKIESLNVSVACGIFLYHMSKIK
ncbi:MAG: hypothetical protein CMG13_05660 [Candidatus Marinimicrobia bacterium]|nr:hypothetical protein [Candidatus Neomarinimicrobiota bacterium]